jgi:hypothetical protein
MSVWVYECIWLCECVSVWVYKCMRVWVYECMSVWVYECMSVWVYECVSVWVYECMNKWVEEFMRVWFLRERPSKLLIYICAFGGCFRSFWYKSPAQQRIHVINNLQGLSRRNGIPSLGPCGWFWGCFRDICRSSWLQKEKSWIR